MLASLLIATQGLMPSPTPLSIGVQGLLFVSVVPPVPINPIDLPGGGGRGREERKVTATVRGVRLVFSVANVEACAGSRIEIVGSSCFANAGDAELCASTSTKVMGARTHSSTNRPEIRFSMSFDVIGGEEENELEVYLMAQAAMALMDD
jgi:hypothetical protein